MEPHISNKLDAGRSPRHLRGAKGLRATHRLTPQQTTTKPGKTLHINVPILPAGTVLPRESLAVLAKITLTGSGSHTNNWVCQNLGKAIVQRRTVLVGEHILEDLVRSDLVKIYADLWRPQEDRDNLVGEGIQTVEVNKHRSGSVDRNSIPCDTALADTFPKYRIPLHSFGAPELLRTHGALATSDFPEIKGNLVLAPASAVIVGSDPTKVGSYQLS